MERALRQEARLAAPEMADLVRPLALTSLGRTHVALFDDGAGQHVEPRIAALVADDLGACAALQPGGDDLVLVVAGHARARAAIARLGVPVRPNVAPTETEECAPRVVHGAMKITRRPRRQHYGMWPPAPEHDADSSMGGDDLDHTHDPIVESAQVL